jgi:hypothetical protein
MKKIKLAVALTVSVLVSACAPNYSEGDRSGKVLKFSKKGLVVKSWEGTLDQGGFRQEANSDGRMMTVPNHINFNADNPSVIADLKVAAETGKRVVLSYDQWFIAPLTIDSSRVINNVKFTD